MKLFGKEFHFDVRKGIPPREAILFALLLLCIIASLFLPEAMIGRDELEKARREACVSKLRALSKVCQLYAETHNGEFPFAPLQSEGTAQLLSSCGFLSDKTIVECLSGGEIFPSSSFHFIPGVNRSMSSKMPCVIEKITNHERLIGVIFVDGSILQLQHTCSNYSELIVYFKHLKEKEKDLLLNHFRRLDIP